MTQKIKIINWNDKRIKQMCWDFIHTISIWEFVYNHFYMELFGKMSRGYEKKIKMFYHNNREKYYE